MEDKKMSLDEFFEMIEENGLYDTMVVTLRYKYKFDKTWEVSNEILIVENSDFVWLYDWDEGYVEFGEVEVMGFKLVRKIKTDFSGVDWEGMKE